ncbi:MAG: TolC family protein, partial [Myxococcales bacterium]
GLEGLVEQGKGTVELARSRVTGGQIAPVEVDRLEIDQGRLEQQVLAAEADERSLVAACAPFVGVPCAPFRSGDEARGFLQAWLDQAERLDGDVEQRPEARGLEALRRAADAEGQLARAQALPDLTVRLGYVYDRFVISGDQRHSLNLSVALPIPLFDRGQAQVAAAEAKQRRLDEQRQRLVASDRARLTPLRDALARQRQRQQSVVTRLLPRARGVLTDLERATSGRLLSLTEVLQARRTVNELLIEEADSLLDAFDNALELTALLAPLTPDRETP